MEASWGTTKTATMTQQSCKIIHIHLNSTRKAGSSLSASKCTTELEIGKEERPRELKKKKIFFFFFFFFLGARGGWGGGVVMSWKVGTSGLLFGSPLPPPPAYAVRSRA